MGLLIPHIVDETGLGILEKIDGLGPQEVEAHVRFSHPDQSLPASGGTPITNGDLKNLRTAIVDVAIEFGFPDERLVGTAGFDRACAAALWRQLPVSAHTASGRGVWTFVTCCVLPDVAVWRFPKRASERFLGDLNRNAFRRLWWRVETLGMPPEGPDPIWDREDTLVQVMERPGLTGSPEVARAVCRVYRTTSDDLTGPQHEKLMRNFLLRCMRRAAFTHFELLDSEVRLETLNSILNQAHDALDLPPMPDHDFDLEPNDRVETRRAPTDSTSLVDPDDGPTKSIYDVPLDQLLEFVVDSIVDAGSVEKGDLSETLSKAFLDAESRSGSGLIGSFSKLAVRLELVKMNEDGTYEKTEREAPFESADSVSDLISAAESLRTSGASTRELRLAVAKSSFRHGEDAAKPYLKAANIAANRV